MPRAGRGDRGGEQTPTGCPGHGETLLSLCISFPFQSTFYLLGSAAFQDYGVIRFKVMRQGVAACLHMSKIHIWGKRKKKRFSYIFLKDAFDLPC